MSGSFKIIDAQTLSLNNVTKQLEIFVEQMEQEYQARERSLLVVQEQLAAIDPEIDRVQETICKYDLELQQGWQDKSHAEGKIQRREIEIEALKQECVELDMERYTITELVHQVDEKNLEE